MAKTVVEKIGKKYKKSFKTLRHQQIFPKITPQKPDLLCYAPLASTHHYFIVIYFHFAKRIEKTTVNQSGIISDRDLLKI